MHFLSLCQSLVATVLGLSETDQVYYRSRLNLSEFKAPSFTGTASFIRNNESSILENDILYEKQSTKSLNPKKMVP
jgi:hypothetical protein